LIGSGSYSALGFFRDCHTPCTLISAVCGHPKIDGVPVPHRDAVVACGPLDQGERGNLQRVLDTLLWNLKGFVRQ